MANKAVIDVEARFVDHVTNESKSATKAIEGLGKEADKAQKQLGNLSKKPVKPIFDADDNRFLKKIRSMESKMQKLGRKKTAAVLDVIDKGTVKIGKLVNKAQSFANKTWQSVLKIKDSDAYQTITKVTDAAKNLVRKTWTTAVKIKDYATAPLRKIKDSLFSIKSLIMAITAGMAAKQFVLNPINLADQYSSAYIGFSTLLGESRGQEMMDEIDLFAKKTPFKTSGVISNVQKMMAMGWDVERVIKDMETIGDAAAATGKGDEGLASITYALSEIRSKGKLSTQEINQLASAGIKAKAYLAEGLGFGTSDAGMKKLAEALEKGSIGANQAIDLILQGMEEFDGMMDKTANETVEGLKSQLEDVFEINIARRWGQGLQQGARRGLGSIISLLDDSQESIEKFGDSVYEVGALVGNWFADKLERIVKRIEKIVGSSDFQNADLKGKMSMLWKGAIGDPVSEWWEGNKEKVTQKAVDIGMGIGKAIVNGIVAGFAALPWWAQLLVGGYVGGRILSGAGTAIGGAKAMAPAAALLIGSTGNAMVGGSGLSGLAASAGYALTGGAAASTLSGGAAAAIGGGSILGGIAGALGIFSGLSDIFKGTRKNGKAAKDDYFKGGSKIGLVGTGAGIGAAIGSIFGGVGAAPGALIGAGIGGLGALFGGSSLGKFLSDFTDDLPETMSKIGEGISAFFTETIPEKMGELWDGVTTFLTEKIPYALGYAAGKTVVFFTETIPNAFSTLWDNLGTFFTDTLPTWASNTWNDKIVPFFTETIPGFFSTLWDNVTTFFTETLPSIGQTIWDAISGFFTETLPGWINSALDSVGGFFKGIGGWFKKGYTAGKEGKYRGGIVGGSSAMEGFARGGIVGGSTRFIRVNEESPEMIIPLSSQRRGRALKLWAQAGNMMGVPGFARGGLTNGAQDEGFRFQSYSSSDSSVGGQTVQVDVGGLTFEIHVNGNDATSITEAIKAQAAEIAETVAGVLADALGAQFENTPARGGVA